MFNFFRKDDFGLGQVGSRPNPARHEKSHMGTPKEKHGHEAVGRGWARHGTTWLGTASTLNLVIRMRYDGRHDTDDVDLGRPARLHPIFENFGSCYFRSGTARPRTSLFGVCRALCWSTARLGTQPSLLSHIPQSSESRVFSLFS